MNRFKPITNDEWLLCNEFNRQLRDEFIDKSYELADETLKAYKSNLAIWFNYVRLHKDNIDHIKIRTIDFLDYRNYLLSNGHSSNDLRNKKAAISSLNNYIMTYKEDQYPNFRNFVANVKLSENVAVRDKLPPNKAEMKMLCDAMREKGDLQKLAFLMFSFETACRRGEIIQLLKEVVNYKPVVKDIVVVNTITGAKEVKEVKYYVTHKIRAKGSGKTGKIRKYKLGEETMQALRNWVDSRSDDCPYMFVSKHNKEVKQATKSIFNQWAKSTFEPLLGRYFTVHDLRRARASSASIEDNMDIDKIKSLLGHANIQTTQGYIIKNEDEDTDAFYLV